MKNIICLFTAISVFMVVITGQLSAQDTPSRIKVSRTVEDGGTGPYPALMATYSSLPTHTVFHPADLDIFKSGQQLPIIVWGNGACANSPWGHINFLSEVASHGFIVVAIGPMPKEGEKETGKSKSNELIEGMDWAIAQHNDPKSPFFQKIDITKISVSGMSCGGLQALEVSSDPRVSTLVVYNSGIFDTPGNGRSAMPNLTKSNLDDIHTPTLYMLGGEKDIAYANGMDDYSRINHVPVFVANMDVGHGGTYEQPHGGAFAEVATAWYKWQLKGDQEAGRMFSGDEPLLQQDKNWTIAKKNMP